MQMKEKAVTDSGERWRGRRGEMEARRETEAGNSAGVPSILRCRYSASARGNDDTAAATLTERPGNQSVTAGQNRTSNFASSSYCKIERN